MELYRLRYSSYDGCNGWTYRYGDDVYSDKDKAIEEATKQHNEYVRCAVEPFKTK